MHDLLVRGGTVFDGTGSEGREADVAIDGHGTIVAVGRDLGAARRELDARGKLVTPGFVDIHTHYDAQATWDPWLTPSSWHGCTTVVMGNCGVGFAPAAPDRHDWLIGLMEGVEDIPGAAMVEGITWGWESFGEFLDALERMPRALDLGTQVPHCALRAYVMGDRADDPRALATEADMREMARLVKEGLGAGALGFSTSRTSLHKTKDGVLVPGTFAPPEELMAIAMGMREAGHGVFQHATEHADVVQAFPWMRELARQSGRTVTFTLSQVDWAPDLWRDVLGELDKCRAEGLPIYGQSAGRAIGIIMAWELTAHPFAGHPTFRALAHLSAAERLAELRKPEVKARLLAEQPVDLGPFGNIVTRAVSKMYSHDGRVDYEPRKEDAIGARAQREGRPPLELAYEALMAQDGKGQIYFPLFNYAYGDLSICRELQLHPQVRMGLSDAGAHCGAICDGGMPTFMLTHWTRDRTRGERLPLAHVIRRQTMETAALYGLHDRGVLAPGYRADVNVIDYDRLGFQEPEVVHDLPAGGRRLIQRATGYVATLVAGVPVVEHGQPTGQLPGKLVRGPRPSPSRAARPSG
jgi:N-acyl-D-amino-acid deacylase